MTAQLASLPCNPTSPSRSFAAAFAASLSEQYRRRFDAATVAEHAAVSAARRPRPVHVGRFSATPEYGPGVCVVAKDRPGLLAAISAALVAVGLDVIRGEAHTRYAAARSREAVDLFWVRTSRSSAEPECIPDETIDSLAQTLDDIVCHRRRPSDPDLSRAALGRGETCVRFLESDGGHLEVLEVEADDRPGLLLSLSSALRDQKVSVVSCEVDTQAGRARDRFTIQDRGGAPIDDRRRLALQVAVLSAVDRPKR